MPNEGDYGQEAEEFFREHALKSAMDVTGKEMLTGFCQNDCGEPTTGAFCSADCRRDFNARRRLRG